MMTSLAALRTTDPASGPVPDAVPDPTATPPGAAVPVQVSSLPNPSSRLDAALGLVVLVFRDSDGQTRTIPSERELEAYRTTLQAGSEPASARDIATGA